MRTHICLGHMHLFSERKVWNANEFLFAFIDDYWNENISIRRIAFGIRETIMRMKSEIFNHITYVYDMIQPAKNTRNIIWMRIHNSTRSQGHGNISFTNEWHIDSQWCSTCNVLYELIRGRNSKQYIGPIGHKEI